MLAVATAVALASAPVVYADNFTLVPVLVKGHNADDSGTELGPNRFGIGRDGTLTVSLRWKTDNGESVATRCHEVSKIVDGVGNVVFERQQDLGGGCSYGGNWRARLKGIGNYTYVLDVADRDSGANLHAELPFEVVLF
ncbi:hypothetical protein JNN96_27895 [Mycobacterium sp. DSM 3803]|nr:hypothetical protein [Mycobacterium sp. DSM 3803]